MSRDNDTLDDMLRFCRLAQEFLQGMDVESFRGDLKTQSSVIHQLMLLGEAATRLSTEIRNQLSQITWKKVVGMRNKLIHTYDDVDLNLVWITVTKDIPEVIVELERFCSG